MTIERRLEPEMADTAEESQEYLQMNHQAVNAAFVDDLIAGGSVGPRVMDLGCGPGLIPIELCRRLEQAEVMAVDGAVEMLELARFELEFAGLTDRVTLEHADLKSMDEFDDSMADTVISNSVCHHLPDPEVLMIAAARLVKPGGRVFLRDLVRPETEAEVEELVRDHAAGESAAGQRMLRQSLHASVTVAEAAAMAARAGIPAGSLARSSDRHWTLDWIRPA